MFTGNYSDKEIQEKISSVISHLNVIMRYREEMLSENDKEILKKADYILSALSHEIYLKQLTTAT